MIKTNPKASFNKLLQLEILPEHPFKEKELYIALTPCENLQCACRFSKLFFRTAEQFFTPKTTFQIEIDIDERKVIEPKTTSNPSLLMDSSKIKSFFEDNLTDLDWAKLMKIHQLTKELQIDHTDLTTLNIDFPKKYLDDPGSLIRFRDLFPLASCFKFTEGEVTYAIEEQYCINHRCNCTDIVLDITEDNESYSQIVWYNYRTGKLSTDKHFKSKIDLPTATRYINILKKKYADFNQKFKMRNAALRQLFENFVQRETKGKGKPQRKTLKKISRNAPCPCGSGKKYKRCCGKRR